MNYAYRLINPDFTVKNIDIFNISRDKGFQYSTKDRRKHAFIYTASGLMRNSFFQDDNLEIDVKAGELIFIPKGSTYIGTYADEGTEIKQIQFDIVGENLPPYLCGPQKINLPEAGKQIDAFLEPLKTNKTSNPFYYLSCIYELLWMIDMSYSEIPSKYKKLQLALSEIAEHYNRNEKIAYYASLCDMSEANFRRLFHEYTGQSPIEYRNDIRLNNAKIKLQSGMYNVSEAAETSGFTNLSFFTRLYKKKFGYTPKKE